MKAKEQDDTTISDELITTVVKRLVAGKRVRRTLPRGGRIHVDRPLPFLCVYREPVDRPDAGTAQLINGEAAFLTTTGAKPARSSLSRLVTQLAESMSEQFGAFLIVEIWSAPDTDVAAAAQKDEIEPTEFCPDFVVTARGPNVPQRTLESLRKNLGRISILKQHATVTVDTKGQARPPGLPYLMQTPESARLRCQTVGLCVRPIYRDHATGRPYPAVLRLLKRGLGRALKQTFFTFAKTRTNSKPEHHYSLGRRAMVKAVWEVDRRLAEVADSFDFLLQVTPVNAEAAWHEFRRGKFGSPPRFYYRPLAVEPAVLKRRLYEVRIENIEDPTLAELFHQRQDELDRKITMLSDVGTGRFLLGSLQVYGNVHEDLRTLAEDILRLLPSRSREDSSGGMVNAQQFAIHAEKEFDYYRDRCSDFSAAAVVRDDMFSGLLCSGGNLLIGCRTQIPRRRVEALLQHEVGTHLLTYYNGLAEPFQQLHSGFAGYDALQEGLAVLSEYLVGGLSTPRLRLLAARVVASRLLVDGASFMDTFRKLDQDYDFPQRTAYTITMRTYRGGGLTKDGVYLRGLVAILEYLNKGGQLDPLFVGKIAVDHIPFIRELQHRKVLRPPPLKPRYLELPGVAERLERVRNGVTVLDLIKGKR